MDNYRLTLIKYILNDATDLEIEAAYEFIIQSDYIRAVELIEKQQQKEFGKSTIIIELLEAFGGN